MRFIFLVTILIVIIIGSSTTVSATWLQPKSPPPKVYNNYTNITVNHITANGGTFNGDVSINGNLSINGGIYNVTIQNINGSIIPMVNNIFNLGSETFYWANLYATNVHADNLYNTTQIDEMMSNMTSAWQQNASDQLDLINSIINTTGDFVLRAGDTMGGNLSLGGNSLLNVDILGFDYNDSDVYFKFNDTNQTLELWVNGMLQQDWGSSTTIYTEATFADDAFFENIFLKNAAGDGIFLNTSLIVAQTTTSGLYIGDGSGLTNVCLSNGTGCNWTAMNMTSFISLGAGKYLYNVQVGNQTYIYLNESVLNNTIDERTGIFEINMIVDVSGGNGINSSEFAFPRPAEILEITTTPITLTNSYRIELNGTTTGTIVDRNRIQHTGEWFVAHRGTVIQGETISAYVIGASVDEQFNVNIKYRQ